MRVLLGIQALLGAPLLYGCDPSVRAEAEPTADPALIRMALPDSLGKPDRPAVEFDHRMHVKALEKDGCASCHPVTPSRQLLPRLKLKKDPSSAAAWMKSHHEVCLGCHDNRRKAGKPSGPDECGECHVKRRAPWQDVSRQMHFDYSLHFRHVRAFDDKCDACHHAYDPKQRKLAYQAGAEDACAACHRPADGKGETSLSDAVHTACVNCHIERQGKGVKTGPRQCEGCHGAEELAKIVKVKDAPHPERGQLAASWMASRGTTYGSVPFDHRLHERQVDSCAACHHRLISKCDECHTMVAQPKGGGISLNQAHHAPDSKLSCVGCHRQYAERGMCAGCHKMLPLPPGQSACDRCHSGPPRDKLDWKSDPLAGLTPQELPVLPAVSAEFLGEFELGLLAKRYRPAKFPHGKIVAALDRAVRRSRLAGRFHKGTETLCAGCHHNSPPGEPVAACRSCHNERTYPQEDLPGLNAAYHRQCIGCHQAIGHAAQGCTDCHEELRK